MEASKHDRPAKQERKSARREKILKYLKQNTWLLLLAVLVPIALVLFILVITGGKEKKPVPEIQSPSSAYHAAFICAQSTQVPYYDSKLEQLGTVDRGTQVTYSTSKPVSFKGVRYYLTYLDKLQTGYVSEQNLTESENKVVQETTVFVRSPQNLRLSADNYLLGTFAPKGTELKVLGYDYLENGAVHLYQVQNGDSIGYISGLYTAATAEEADEVYDRFGVHMTHSLRGDSWGGGDGGSLDYYPRVKASYTDNVMPETVYSLYLTCDPEVIGNIDAYIAYAKTTNINAFVVNIMDGTSVGYPSEVYL